MKKPLGKKQKQRMQETRTGSGDANRPEQSGKYWKASNPQPMADQSKKDSRKDSGG